MKPIERMRVGTALKRCARLACLLLPLFAACTEMPLIPPSNFEIDPAALEEMNAHGDRMIIVTVANPSESVPMLAGTTGGAYDGAPGYAAYGSARATVAELERDYPVRQVTAWPIMPLQVHCAVLEVTGKESREDVLASLAHDRRVKIAQPLQSFRTLGTVGTLAAPNYDGNYVDLERGLKDIDALAAQRVSQGKDVRVAVIDTGIDVSHPDLAGRIALSRDFVDHDPSRFDRDAHGTAVAGVIAANPSNGRGIIGVAPGAKILALKACWQQSAANQGAPAGVSVCNSLTLAEALTVAIDLHAQVVNLSLSGPPDPLLTQLIEYLLRHGAIVVGAMPPNGDLRAFPVGVPQVIAADVAGSGSNSPAVIHAPGHDVLTLAPGGHYDFKSGSSFSTAYVSGIAALLLALDPQLDADQVLAALKASVNHAGAVPTVNACNALAAVALNACATLSATR